MKPPLWQWVDDPGATALLTRVPERQISVLTCRVPDGTLQAIRDTNTEGLWHLSITHQPKRRRKHRFPTWAEVAHARNDLLPANLTVVVYLPPPVAAADDTLHLFELRHDR